MTIMPCDSAGHMVHYTCGHFKVIPSSQPCSCGLENCKDHSSRTCSYLPESCLGCTDWDSIVSDCLLDLNIAKPKRFGPDPEANQRLLTKKKADITSSSDDKQKSTSKTPSEAETKSSFPDNTNCECSNTTIKYEGCNHTVQNIHRTQGCANECADRNGNEHVIPEACPDCSAHSRLKGNDKEDLRDPRMNPDRLMRLAIEKIEKKLSDQGLLTNSIYDGNTKKVEASNKDLKKFIAGLTLTGPIKALFSEAEQGTTHAHVISWELRANQLFLELEMAARVGMDFQVTTLKQRFLDEGENFKNQIKSQLELVKDGVLKQCEVGVKQMLEAFEDSSLEDSFPSSSVL